MNLSQQNLDVLRGMVEGEPKNVVILSHTNPDGDAVGSSIAWAEALRHKGHNVECVVPNKYPYYLDWMSGIGNVIIYKNDAERVEALLAEADVLFCLDFHSYSRLDALGDIIAANVRAKRVLIDHHLDHLRSSSP